MREGPLSPEQVANHPVRTLVGRRLGIRSLAALGLLVPALIVGGASCAMGGGAENSLGEVGAGVPPGDDSRTLRRNLITAEEMRSVSVGTLYEVVQRLRPLWLRSGPQRSRRVATEIMVIQNGMYFGPVESLRDLTPDNVLRIRHVDGPTAAATFSYPGVQPHIEGAIVVEFGSGPPR